VGLFDVIAQSESSGGRNLFNPVSTSSGHAQGWYGITTGTWSDFAPKAGVSLRQYPEPNSAPQSIQQMVASLIPLKRWDSNTRGKVEAAYPGLDASLPLGQLATMLGDTPAAAGTAAAGGAGEGDAASSEGIWSGLFSGFGSYVGRWALVLVAIIMLAGGVYLFAAREGVVPGVSGKSSL
jgi:hypothetical protein